MKVHYFQRYHEKENVATANTMLLLSRLYSYSSDKFFRFLKSEYFSEAFEPELVFTLQEKSIDSIPDATITQEGFKIVVETKLTDWFYSKQLMNHLKSFGDEKHKIMITLSSELMNDDKKKYFEEQLQRIREIRMSERMFYQKITDIYATSVDYDAKSKTTQEFFAKVQNKLHWAIHGQTAAEVIYNRADANKEHMGLTTWEGAPQSKIHKYDVSVAKNYLTEEELRAMGRIVNAYLDLAEAQAERNMPMTMEDWASQLDGLLRLTRRDILQGAGKISAELAKQHAETEFEKYRIIQDRLYHSDFDYFLELENLVNNKDAKGNEDE